MVVSGAPGSSSNYIHMDVFILRAKNTVFDVKTHFRGCNINHACNLLPFCDAIMAIWTNS